MMRTQLLRITRLVLIFIAILTIAMAFCLVQDDNVSSPAEATGEKPYVWIYGLNTKTVDFNYSYTLGDTWEESSKVVNYPKSGENINRFAISLVVPDGYTGTGNIYVKYRTYDMTAVSAAGDYTAKDEEIIFKYNENTKKYDNVTYSVNITTKTTDYGLYEVSGQYDDMLDDMNDTIWVESSGARDAYISRYFAVEIYDVQGDADILKGKGTTYGMMNVDHLLPYIAFNDSEGNHTLNSLAYYTVGFKFDDLTKITQLRDDPKFSGVTIKTTTFGAEFSNNIIETGLGHYYFTGTGKIDGEDVYQNDSQVGLWYTGWEDIDCLDNKTLENQCGVITIEMDGYPDGEKFNFGLWGKSQSDDSEMEWSEDSYQLEEYRANNLDSKEVYYRVQGSPSQIGMSGKRWSKGANRYIKDIKMYTNQVDDSSITIENIYLDTTDKTKDDCLRAIVRFSEPVYINLGGASLSYTSASAGVPTLVAYLNGDSSCKVSFEYESGAGSDTLVFKYNLSRLAEGGSDEQEINITTIKFIEFTNPQNICDFSYTNGVATGKITNTDLNYLKGDKYQTFNNCKKYSQWCLANTLGESGEIIKSDRTYYTFTDVGIDVRKPTIYSINCDTALESKQTQSVNVSFGADARTVKKTVYAHWTEDMNGSSATTIKKPTYLDSDIITSSSSIYEVKASLTGLRYLWVKVVSTFGKVDERLYGPIYFDNDADGVSNITMTDASGPTKTKIVQFTINHTTDYTTSSGVKRIDLVWAYTSPWASNTALYYNSEYNAKGTELAEYAADTVNLNSIYVAKKTQNRVEIVDTQYASAYEYTAQKTDNVAQSSADIPINFFKKTDDSGNYIYTKNKYVTSTTYKVTIGYSDELQINDFALSDGDFAKVYLGFLVTDNNGNIKNPLSSDFIANADYMSDEYSYFDTRNIIIPDSIDYPDTNNILSALKITDESVKAFSLNADDDEIVDFVLNLKTTDRINSSKFTGVWNSETSSYEKLTYKIVISKPNDADHPSYKSESYDSVGVKETPWFDVQLVEDSSNPGYYTKIKFTTRPYSEISDSLFGYYDISIEFTDDTSTVTEVKNTQTLSIYLSKRDSNNVADVTLDNTVNLTAYDKGTMFTNSVYQLDSDASYYYLSSSSQAVKQSYVKNNNMTFSSESEARRYLIFMEMRDLYLWRISSSDDANALNDNAGEYRKADGITKTAKEGQYWIRYKRASWKDSTATTSWVYYYYGDSTDSDAGKINTRKVEDNNELYSAIKTVVETIMTTYGSQTMLTKANDGLDSETGSPYIADECIMKSANIAQTFSGCAYTSELQYSADANLYDSFVTLNVTENSKSVVKSYPLVSTADIIFGEHTNLYIRMVGDDSGFYGKVASGKDLIIKDVIYDVCKQIEIQIYKRDFGVTTVDESLIEVEVNSGVYEILEIDENGAHRLEVYIDVEAPIINYTATHWENSRQEELATHHKTSESSMKLIEGISFTIKGLGEVGFLPEDGYTEPVAEIDSSAYIVVYDSSHSRVIDDGIRTAEELRTNPLTLTDGIYYVDVYDRSGNHYTLILRLNSDEINAVTEAIDEVSIRIKNRTSEEIEEFQVKLNNVIIDRVFSTKKTYSESGTYDIYIKDIYGNTYTETKVFQRVIPTVVWMYESGSQFVNIDDTTECVQSTKLTSQTFRIITSKRLAFKYSSTAGYKYSFVDCDPDVTATVGGRYLVIEQNTTEDFTVKIYYESYPDIYVTYYVMFDIDAPAIDVSYVQYSFEHHEQYDAMIQLYDGFDANGNWNSYYQIGETIDPRRIDFEYKEFSDRIVLSGSTISTSSANVKLDDASGVKRMVIYLNDEIIYDGVYNAEGTYDDELSHNKLTSNGTYKIVAYDVLGNMSTFTFANQKIDDVEYSVDGEVINPTEDAVYRIYPESGTYVVDENGDKITDYWKYVSKFEVTDDEESKYSIADRSNKDNIACYVRNGQRYTKVEYGNSAQTVTIDQDCKITYLFTDKNGETYYVCFHYVDGSVYQVSYVVIKIEDVSDEGEISTEYSIADNEELVVSKSDLRTGVAKAVFNPQNTPIVVYLTFTASGKAQFSVYVINDDDKTTLDIETKVVSDDNVFEPAYFKTQLTLRSTNITIYNDDGAITDESIGGYEIIYTHGSKLAIDIENEAKKDEIVSVKISYSDVSDFKDYYYLYFNGEMEATKMWEDRQFVDGYYIIIVENIYGNTITYHFAMANSLLVTCTVTYSSGWTRQYPTSYTDTIYSNHIVQTTVQEANTSYNVEKDNVDITSLVAMTTTSGDIILTFTDVGSYKVTFSDKYGNKIVKSFVIKEDAELNLAEGILTGYNEKALRKAEGFTNNKISVAGELALANGVAYISYTKDGVETIIYDVISRLEDRVEYDADKLVNAIGANGNGAYYVTFRNIYGDEASMTVHYREDSTLYLSRTTRISSSAQEYDIATATDPVNGIGFWANNTLMFDSVATTYIFQIDGIESQCPKTLTFSSNVNEAKVEYKVYYIDEYGFEYSFMAYLYRATMSATPDESVTAVVDVNGTKMTKNNIVMKFTDGAECVYYLDNNDAVVYKDGDVLRQDGVYKFVVEDIAGNITMYTLVKDTVVYYGLYEGTYGQEVKNGFITSATNIVFNRLNNDSAYISKVFVNGVEHEWDMTSEFNESGVWELLVKDDVGNESYFKFYLLTHSINHLDYYEPQNYKFNNIWYILEDGTEVSRNSLIETDSLGKLHYNFYEDGSYKIEVESLINNVKSTFIFTINTEKPNAMLNGCNDGESTINDITLANTTAGDTIYVYKDGELIETYSVVLDGDSVTISEAGTYRIVVKNLAGNEVEYNFTRKHVANTAGSALIIIALVLMAIGLVVGLLYRNRSRVDK